MKSFQDSITLRVIDFVLLLGQDFVPTPYNLTIDLFVANLIIGGYADLIRKPITKVGKCRGGYRRGAATVDLHRRRDLGVALVLIC